MMWRLATGAPALAIFLVLHAPAHGATFVVNATADAVDATPGDGVCATATGACTLRAAVQEANALAGDDAVTLPAGTFLLSLVGDGEDAAATGDLDVAQGLTITGAGMDETIIDGVLADRIVQVQMNVPFAIGELTLRNGIAGATAGGAILHLGGAGLTVTNVVLRRNVANQGGAIFMAEGPLTIVGSTFEDNVAGTVAGAVLHTAGASPLDLRDSAFVRNAAASGPAGGLLYQGMGAAAVANSRFSGNRGANGGSLLLITTTTASVTASTFEDSQAPGMAPVGCLLITAATASVTDSTFRRCVGGAGFGALLASVTDGVTVTGSTFEDNTALGMTGAGSLALIAANGTIRVENTTITGGSAIEGQGGGLFVTASNGDVVLDGVVLEDNTAAGVGGGGYVAASGAVSVSRSRVARNLTGLTMGVGGGLYVTAASLSLVDTTIADNVSLAGVAGGAYLSASGDMLVDRSTLSNNQVLGGPGVAGGALLAATGTLTVRNSTVSGNYAQVSGGGLYLTGATQLIEGCTFAGNEALTSGAALLGVTAATIRSTVIASTAVGSCAGAAHVSGGDNLDQDGSCALAAAGDRTGIDPQLGPLQDNGGPTFTHEPLPASPLIDGVTGGTCLATDQRGVARPTDGNGDGTAACDVGAVEFVDECPTDPDKRLPGVCGCGVPDVDANTNGAVDCLINAELKARITTSRTVMQGLTGDKTPEQTAARAELTALADGLLAYVTDNQGAIVTTDPSAKLVKLAKKARKLLRATRKGKGGALARKQTRAGKALDALDGAVAPQP